MAAATVVEDIHLEDDIPTETTLTFEFEATRYLSGREVVWDISGYTITGYFKDPQGNIHTVSATITSGPDGEFSYTTTVTDVDEEGDWWMLFKAVSGSGAVILKSPRIHFKARSLAAA